MTVRKAERLLNLIVLLLETSRPLTPQQIHGTIPGYGQQNWQSFLRMFERDKDELRNMGVPIELGHVDVWESEEGYSIPKERYYLPDLELAPDEITSLWLAAGLLRLPDPGAARTALLKLSGEVPSTDEKSALSWLAADLGLAGATASELPKAYQAVVERRVVTFDYRSEHNKSRTVEPYGLVHRRGAWYIVGRDRQADGLRSFRMDRLLGPLRINDPSSEGDEFEVPEGFRPDAALEAPPFVQGEPLHSARVRFSSGAAWRIEREFPWLDLVWLEEGRAEASLEVSDVAGFVSWLLWFADEAELTEPQELQAEVLQRLEEICG